MQEYGFSAKFSDFFGNPPIPYSDWFPKLSSFKRTYKGIQEPEIPDRDCLHRGGIYLPFFTQTAEEPNFAGIRELQERKGIGNKYCKSLRTNGIRVKKKSSGSED